MSLPYFVLISTFQIALLIRAASGLFSAWEMTTAANAYWRRDRQIRVCGLAAAFNKNIESAVLRYESTLPELSNTERAAIKTAEARIISESNEYFGERLLECGSVARSWSLEFQRHTGQPKVWPNWVLKLQVK